MVKLSLSIPALLFPAISLLMISYTTKFLALATVVRELHKQHEEDPSPKIAKQIRNLRKRLLYIRNMQAMSISGFFANVVSMFLILVGLDGVAVYLFGLSLVLLSGSLIICFMEIYLSVDALKIQLSQNEEEFCSECDFKGGA